MPASMGEEFIRIAFMLSFDRCARERLGDGWKALSLSDYDASWMLVRVIHDALFYREAAAGVCSEAELQARQAEYARDEGLYPLLTAGPEFQKRLLKDPPSEP